MKAIQILQNFEVTSNGNLISFQRGTFIDRYEIRDLLHTNKNKVLGYETIVSIIPEKDVKYFENLMILAKKVKGYHYRIMPIEK